MAIKFQDTFTGTDDDLASAHAPDTEAGSFYLPASDFGGDLDIISCAIQGNKLGALAADEVTGNNSYHIYHDSDIAFAVGDEVFVDLTIAAPDTIQGNLLEFLLFPDAPSGDDPTGFGILVTQTSDALVTIQGISLNVGSTNLAVGFAWAEGTAKRLGVTLTSATSFDVWTEPAGGGSRTSVATWAVADLLSSPTNNKVGLYHGPDGAGRSQQTRWDNLTVLTPEEPGEPADSPGTELQCAVRLDRTFAGAAAGSSGNTSYLLPYPLAIDGSDGTVVIVRSDGYQFTVSRSDTTHATAAEADTSGLPVTIGVSYDLSVDLSTMHFRSQLRDGDRQTEVRGRMQIRNLLIGLKDTRRLDVEVTPTGRPLRTTAHNEDVETDMQLRVPVLTENTQASISIINDTPFASFITGLDWEALYHSRSRRI
jgi:hypothetical protein